MLCVLNYSNYIVLFTEIECRLNTLRLNKTNKNRSKNRSRPWDQTNLVLNSTEKVKTGSLLSLMCMFPESNGTKFWSHSFHLQNSAILQTMDQRGNPMKTNFDISQIRKWISQTVRAQKVDEKNGVIYPVSFFPSWIMVLKLPKIVRFFANLCWPQQEI